MNPALLRYVADYLSDHAARTVAGDGARGRVQIDVQLDSCLNLRFEADRCHVELTGAGAVDCNVKMPWLRLVQILDEELHPRDALDLGMVKIDGDRRLGERALCVAARQRLRMARIQEGARVATAGQSRREDMPRDPCLRERRVRLLLACEHRQADSYREDGGAVPRRTAAERRIPPAVSRADTQELHPIRCRAIACRL